MFAASWVSSLRVRMTLTPAPSLGAGVVMPPRGETDDERDLAEIRTNAAPELVSLAVKRIQQRCEHQRVRLCKIAYRAPRLRMPQPFGTA